MPLVAFCYVIGVSGCGDYSVVPLPLESGCKRMVNFRPKMERLIDYL